SDFDAAGERCLRQASSDGVVGYAPALVAKLGNRCQGDRGVCCLVPAGHSDREVVQMMFLGGHRVAKIEFCDCRFCTVFEVEVAAGLNPSTPTVAGGLGAHCL